MSEGPLSNPVRWITRNKYRHMEAFMAPALESSAVPGRLAGRVRRRIKHARRLNAARVTLYLIIVFAALGSAVVGLVDAFASDIALAFRLAVFIAALFSGTLGVVLLPFANRTLGILEAEIYILSMQVVALEVRSRPDD